MKIAFQVLQFLILFYDAQLRLLEKHAYLDRQFFNIVCFSFFNIYSKIVLALFISFYYFTMKSFELNY